MHINHLNQGLNFKLRFENFKLGFKYLLLKPWFKVSIRGFSQMHINSLNLGLRNKPIKFDSFDDGFLLDNGKSIKSGINARY